MYSSNRQNIKPFVVSDVRFPVSNVRRLVSGVRCLTHFCVRARVLTVAIFNGFWWNVAQTSGTWHESSLSLGV